MPKADSLDVVVVNWNTKSDCERLLAGLDSLQTRPETRVWVVDNASTDGSATHLEQRFPWASVLRSPRNLGYAGGVNLALERSAGRFTLVLNPDLELAPRQIEALLASLISAPGCGALGPALVVPGEGYQVGAAGQDSGVRSALAHFSLLSRCFPRAFPGLYLSQEFWARAGRPLAVDWVCGAAVLFRREALDAIGGFPTESFLYAEDLDVCRRVRGAGFQVVYDPRIEVVHRQGGSQRGDPLNARWVAATLADFDRRAGLGRRGLVRLVFGGGFLARYVAYRTAGAVSGDPRLASRAARMRAYAEAALWPGGGEG